MNRAGQGKPQSPVPTSSAPRIFVDPRRRYPGVQPLLLGQQLKTISALKSNNITGTTTGLFGGDHIGSCAPGRGSQQTRREGLPPSSFIPCKIRRVMINSINSKFEISLIVCSLWILNACRIQPHERQKIADQQSRSATSRLFNWHRGYDDGIWLDDGTQDIEAIRKLQRHPWIIDPWDDGGNHSPSSEKKPSMLDQESILEWRAKVE